MNKRFRGLMLCFAMISSLNASADSKSIVIPVPPEKPRTPLQFDSEPPTKVVWISSARGYDVITKYFEATQEMARFYCAARDKRLPSPQELALFATHNGAQGIVDYKKESDLPALPYGLQFVSWQVGESGGPVSDYGFYYSWLEYKLAEGSLKAPDLNVPEMIWTNADTNIWHVESSPAVVFRPSSGQFVGARQDLLLPFICVSGGN